jgi:hypothetical protein
MSFRAVLKKQLVLVAFLVVWLPAVAFGINVLWKYSSTPGRVGTPSLSWPEGVQPERTPGRSTLVMFAHPQCPCTSATLGELAIIMAHAHERLDAKVFFYLPSTAPASWARTELWSTASAIPGVHVFEDRDAHMAERFGAFTSGQTLLYDPLGHLQFKGGITALRGHSGDNAGRSAIIALVRSDPPQIGALPEVTPVLGCSLRGE